MTRTEYYFILKDKYQDVDTFSEIERTFRKVEEYFSQHERIAISVSGGSDSDCIIHLVCTYFPEYLDKCRFVFCNTGLEYDATKRHLDDIEEKYGITIDRVRGTSVVTSVRKYGVPILNKYKSNVIDAYQRGKQYAERYIFEDGAVRYHVMTFTEKQREMVRYATKNGIKISDKCCDISKKKPLHDYEKLHNIDLNITGERKAEGGEEQWLISLALKNKKAEDINLCHFGGGVTMSRRLSNRQRELDTQTVMKCGGCLVPDVLDVLSLLK